MPSPNVREYFKCDNKAFRGQERRFLRVEGRRLWVATWSIYNPTTLRREASIYVHDYITSSYAFEPLIRVCFLVSACVYVFVRAYVAYL